MNSSIRILVIILLVSSGTLPASSVYAQTLSFSSSNSTVQNETTTFGGFSNQTTVSNQTGVANNTVNTPVNSSETFSVK